MRPLRILFVTDELPPGPSGGIGVFYRDLALALEAHGARVRIVVSQEGPTDTPRRILEKRWALFREARQVAQQFDPDVVETHDWAAPLIAAPRRPLVVRLHGAHGARSESPSRFWRFLEARALKAADALVSVSEWAADRTARAFGLTGDIPVIPSGVSTDLFRPPLAPRNPEEILFVGSPRVDKGIREVLEAAAGILTARPAAQLTLAGAVESDLAAFWEIVPSALRRRVRCLGKTPRSALPALYGRAAVCVFPGRAEAFGLACLEAMSTGSAVVGSVRGGATELIEPGRSGLLVDPLEPGALQESINLLLGSRDLRRRLGDGARRRAVEQFDLARTASRNLALYQQLCTQTAHHAKPAA